MRTVTKVLLAVVGLLMLWFSVATVFWGVGVATAGIYGRGEVRKQVQSAEFRLEAYQSFFSQCASVQGLEGRIDALLDQLSFLREGTREYAFVLSSLAGVKGLRREAIAKYNQDVLRNYTQGQFRDKDLPYQIPDGDYPSAVRKGGTTCAMQ